SVIPGWRRKVNTTSLTSPSGMTRNGLYTLSPDGSVTTWSSTPKLLRSAKATVTRPIGESATHWPSMCSTVVLANPAAHWGRFAGSAAYSYTAQMGRSITILKCADSDAIGNIVPHHADN